MPPIKGAQRAMAEHMMSPSPTPASARSWLGEVKKLGLELDMTTRVMYVHAKRFSMLIENGTVKNLNIEAPIKYEVSSVEAMLAQ